MNGKRKTRYRPEHMRMLNDRRWLETKRIVWQRAGGLCEWCKRDGYIRAGVDCHHIIPFESAKTTAEMERLCYDPNNCVLLCIPCHQRAHKELGSKKKEVVKARRNERFERWKDSMSGDSPLAGEVQSPMTSLAAPKANQPMTSSDRLDKTPRHPF